MVREEVRTLGVVVDSPVRNELTEGERPGFHGVGYVADSVLPDDVEPPVAQLPGELRVRVLDLVIETASGRYLTAAERLGQWDSIPWKRGVSL